MDREPDQTPHDALRESQAVPVDAPDVPADDRKADVPSSTDVATGDGDGRNDDLANDDGDDGSP